MREMPARTRWAIIVSVIVILAMIIFFAAWWNFASSAEQTVAAGRIQKIIVFGTITSLTWGLLALGFTLIYGVTGVLNFAHSGLYMMGAYLFFAFLTRLGYHSIKNPASNLLPPAIILSIIAVSITGAAIYFLTIHPIIGDVLATLVVTVFVAMVIQQWIYLPTELDILIGNKEMIAAAIVIAALAIFLPAWWKYASPTKTKIQKITALGTTSTLILLLGIFIAVGIFITKQIHIEPIGFGGSWQIVPPTIEKINIDKPITIGPIVIDQTLVKIFGVPVTYAKLVGITVSLALFIAIAIFVEKTKAGRAMRALHQDREMAMLVGINTKKLYALTIALSSATAAIAGIFGPGATSGQAEPGMWLTPLAFAFSIVILGGLGSIKGTFIGCFIVGYTTNIVTVLTARSFLGGPTAFAIMVIVLLLRPKGLFGKRIELE